MEPIKRALSRARSERRTAAESPRFGARPRMPLRPTFTQTRVVMPDPAVLEARGVIAQRPDHPAADVYRALHALILQHLMKNDRSTVGIMSVGPRQGKTLTAINLAIALSLDVNQTVLLVDADLRHPEVHWRLGIEPHYGLDDHLIADTPLSRCLVNPGFDRLVILPVKRAIREDAELLSSPRMVALAGELKHRYPDRLVLYNLPPLLVGGATISFLPQVDTTLLVVEDGTVRGEALKRAVDLLKDHNLMGTVLNAAA